MKGCNLGAVLKVVMQRLDTKVNFQLSKDPNVIRLSFPPIGRADEGAKSLKLVQCNGNLNTLLALYAGSGSAKVQLISTASFNSHLLAL